MSKLSRRSFIAGAAGAAALGAMSAVALAEEKGTGLEALSLDELRSLSPLIEEDVYAVLDYDTAVRRRNTPGGTGPEPVSFQMEALDAWLSTPLAWEEHGNRC